MITLFLLHPLKQIPVQVWSFDNEPVIRIGRSTDNHVILYSAVVSRHHVELRRVGNTWEIINLGTNGTYLDGKRITQVPVSDGAIIRLARSGPNVQIRIGPEALKQMSGTLSGDRTVAQRLAPQMTEAEVISKPQSEKMETDTWRQPRDSPPEDGSPPGTIPVPKHLQLPARQPITTVSETGLPSLAPSVDTFIQLRHRREPVAPPPAPCLHPRGGGVFCVDCGQPLQPLQAIADYQVVKVLGEGDIGITYWAWREGQSYVLKTLNPEWVNQPQARAAFECEVEVSRQLNHFRMPHFIDFFAIGEQPYLVMEFVAGPTLADHVTTKGPVPLPQAIAWILEICEVLDYLHAFVPPILHRGIQPNSLICQTAPPVDGSIAVTDLGAIKALALGRKPSVQASAYGAPEQREIRASPALDLYALGPVLAYLVTGKNPAVFYDRNGPQPYFQAEAVPGLSADLTQILNTLTQVMPEQRYQSATDVAIALRQAALN